ncbi:MAG: hypothetical protein ABOK23_03210 [Candidatus Methanoperedens sp.]|nr:hypothetical protein [Candidatus Methanoperedens sp.]MCZ7395673.1 hypothetical protein [Candidatus Methanoperedens sp.]
MDSTGDLTIFNGKLTILVAFGHGGKVDNSQLKKFIGSEAVAERWNKPIEVAHSEGVAVIVAGNEKITCNTNIYTDVFVAGVSLLRTEIEIRDRILFNDILVALHSNTIIVEGLDFQSFVNKRINETREKLNPGMTIFYSPVTKRYTLLKIKDFTPKLDQKSLKEQYGEVITRFLSGETSIRALHSKEITEKLANDLSYYDEDLFLASTEGVLILGCEDYFKELRELLELAISLLLLFQIYDMKIDVEITNAFDSITKLRSSRYYFLTQAPRKLEKSLLKVSEIGLVILDDIEDLMNPHKITSDWYYQSAYQKMLNTLRVGEFEKVVEHKINSLQELYTTARELSTQQLTLILEVAIVVLILWEVLRPVIMI